MKLYRKGSLTVEASLICPAFIFAILTLIYIIVWFGNAVRLQADMTENARTASAVAVLTVSADKADTAEDITLLRRCQVGCLPVRTSHKVVIRPFVGISTIEAGENDPIVYVTPSGKVYHTNRACSYIKASYKKTLLEDITYKRNRSGAKYKPCRLCCKGNTSGKSEVYITEYGDRYHASSTCSGLYHNVMAIRLSEVSHMKKCSKCGKGK